TNLILDPEEQYFGHIAYSDGVPPKTSDFEYVCLNLEIVNPKEANLIILDKYCKGRSYICNFNSPDY
ncbi:MAG: hypothetical protein K2M00_05595, partial [Muribaculaceae bacterium]|nr:hypothetical protein [Muribaculaceae bacterium]